MTERIAGIISHGAHALAKRRGRIDFDAVSDIARSLPGVEDATTPRGIALKVNGKLFACAAVHKSAEPDSLVVRIGFDERELLLAAEPDTFYLTDHYRGYPAVLVRLSNVTRDTLRDLLEASVRFVGAKKARRRQS